MKRIRAEWYTACCGWINLMDYGRPCHDDFIPFSEMKENIFSKDILAYTYIKIRLLIVLVPLFLLSFA